MWDPIVVDDPALVVGSWAAVRLASVAIVGVAVPPWLHATERCSVTTGVGAYCFREVWWSTRWFG